MACRKCGKALPRGVTCRKCSAAKRFSAEDRQLLRACWAERQRLLKEADEFTLRKLAEKFGATVQAVHYVVTYKGLPE